MHRAPWIPFAAVIAVAVVLLLAAALSGGVWPWLAFVYLAVIATFLDEVMATGPAAPDDAPTARAATVLACILGIVHLAIFWLAVAAIAGRTGLDAGGRLAAFLAFGLLFGQVSNANAHELIHKPHRFTLILGALVYVTHLFGHHTSAHRLVHHVHVATPADPNSARRGEGLWHFARRAWVGSFRAGLAAERLRDARRGGTPSAGPYPAYVLGGLAALSVSIFVAGGAGLVIHLALAGWATLQLLVSDYVQHYGLRRAVDDDGRPEPVSARHSWNARHWFSSHLSLNAPRHSDHHLHPARPFPALQLPDGAPMLPRSLPVMGFVALFPRWWRRVMDPRLDALGDRP